MLKFVANITRQVKNIEKMDIFFEQFWTLLILLHVYKNLFVGRANNDKSPTDNEYENR